MTPPITIATSPYNPFLGGDFASIIIRITTDSPLPLPLSPAIDIDGAFTSVREGGKPASKIGKQVTIVYLTLQDIQ